MCSSSPNIPEPTQTPSTPTTAQSVTARSNQEALARRARGASSTILTSGMGLNTAATTSKPTLLGR